MSIQAGLADYGAASAVYGAAQLSGPRCHIVALHGWGSDSRCWQALIQQLPRCYSLQLIDLPGFGEQIDQHLALEHWLAQLAPQLPKNCVLLGWSLGGMLATRLAAMNNSVGALITVASNLKFVAATDWQRAMAQRTFETFRSDFSRAPAATLERFATLQAMGDSKRRHVVKLLQALQGFNTQHQMAWLAALDTLATADNRVHFSQLELPGLHIFGSEDALVPAHVAERLVELNAGQNMCVLPDAGHAPHISQPQQVACAIREFIAQAPFSARSTHVPAELASSDKQRRAVKKTIAKNFSQAAGSYDSVARLQKKVQQQLLTHTRFHTFPDGPIADLGCGTGSAMPALEQQFPRRRIWGLDFAAGMLRVAQRLQAQRCLLQADIEQLPFAQHSLALCFSSLSVQWCKAEDFLAELYRVLMPGGVALLSTLGPQTLFELKRSWRALDEKEHVNQFASAEQLKTTMQQIGFASVRSQRELCVLQYQSVRHLMRELKGIGARNVNPTRRKGLSSARQLALLEQHYRDNFSGEGKIPASSIPTNLTPANFIPATYEVFYFALVKSL